MKRFSQLRTYHILQLLFVFEALMLIYTIQRANGLIRFWDNLEPGMSAMIDLISAESVQYIKIFAYAMLLSLPLQLKFFLKRLDLDALFLLIIKLAVVACCCSPSW